MNYTENYEGIKIDVEAVGTSLSDTIQQSVRDAILKFKKHAKKIDSVDVYFKEEPSHATKAKSVRMRVGIPGTDVFAQDEGDNWHQLLDNVQQKLIRQLDKR
ncbi:MAG: HPF/RaiA family ribosome-associated protein [Hymenobacteraceae bacterium]|nr:HPF/RaiA family ribosome-associated protein [Hymenobacteraceae bacterium]MDX5395850.1 HPF/RaiA family ribosome-associated protein [Hymenobacteraceae bacterium]MDX5442653.1 HPF/RaiA family ribosome-associated protein [Hymenobacteraceae bacterium]MDX5511905.1 HPF/RaiA family ribosome-associated protein [Hymenobacteraceae bacterium]